MDKRGIEKWMPDKFLRFLRTTAARDSITETSVAAVIITKNGLMVSAGRLPSKAVDRGINEALDALLDDLRVGKVRGMRYLGYCDCGGARQYNFTIDAAMPDGCGPSGTVSIENAIGMLARCEARTVVAALRKKRI